ncbi:predicted protein [Coccidioides posadasii str. Silveira]|uniref:Predicted protein n=1 Tax=Coccidioides posadasii (strain RMSCC 757 / Silveira) TaxID=443226 RepID=E9DEJ2_COCPS|nr:predicted protein [Coccidioides posadasii str. Silveira]
MDNFKACLNLLLRVSKYWGKAKVLHYSWHACGEKYCNTLGAAANRDSRWDEAKARDVSARTPIPSIKLFLKIFLTRFGLLVRASFAASTRLERPESLPKEHLGLVQHKSVLYSTEDEQLSGDGLRGNWGSNGQENN